MNNPALSLMLNLHNIHPPTVCRGRPCVFHRPSDHHMIEWPALWNPIFKFVMRTCTHGINHLDPDIPSQSCSTTGNSFCDGCCEPNYLTTDDFWKELES